MTNKGKTKLIVSTIAVAVAAAHIIFPKINIDNTIVFLLGIAILPWLETLFRAISLPGGIQFQFHDLTRAETEAKKAGLITPRTNLESAAYPTNGSFIETVKENKELAVVSLRIEIEKQLREAAARNGINTASCSAASLIGLLGQKNIFSYAEAAALNNLLAVLNNGSHQREYDERTADWVIENGPLIISNLQNK